MILIFDKQNTGFALFQRYKYNELVWSGFADIQQVTKKSGSKIRKERKISSSVPRQNIDFVENVSCSLDKKLLQSTKLVGKNQRFHRADSRIRLQ